MSVELAGTRGAALKYRLALSGLALSALSFALVFYSACEEPYPVFRWSDFALNVVLGTVLCALFAAWVVACVRRLRRAPRRALGKWLASACVLWTGINLFYLATMVYGYAQDLTNLHSIPRASTP